MLSKRNLRLAHLQGRRLELLDIGVAVGGYVSHNCSEARGALWRGDYSSPEAEVEGGHAYQWQAKIPHMMKVDGCDRCEEQKDSGGGEGGEAV